MKSNHHTFISLDGAWTLYYEENRKIPKDLEYTTETALKASGFIGIPAAVPGNFEIDMQNAGLIDDVFFGANPLEAQKRENLHLWYTRTFTVAEEGSYQFVFEGVDTFADFYLNGAYIGSTDNMLIAHTLKAEGLLLGENELVVHIKPIFLESRKRPIGAGVITHQKYNAESLNVRKAAHMFGWDILPRFLSGGLWRSVRLEKIREEYIDEIYLRAINFRGGQAKMRLYVNAAITGDFAYEYTLRVKGICRDRAFSEEFRLWNASSVFRFDIDEPYLWWTREMGEQNLYDVTAELLHGETVIDTVTFRTGLCKFELKRSSLADEHSEFCFYINEKPLFVRGTNWVPMDALHSRDKERLPRALALLSESGCNMVRLWGGNVYEDEALFDYCDENGIAIWQDFAMGCATYPLNRELCDALEKEVTAVVKKYRHHVSLALWAGDNECDEAAVSWTARGVDPNRNVLTRTIIPSVLAQHDPERAYIPSSPYIDQRAYDSGMPGNTPEKHLWGPRDYFKSDFYTKATAKFASETGYHGSPAPASLAKFLSPERMWPWQNNPEWQLHATCIEVGEHAQYAFRLPLMAKQIKVLFDEEPDNLERFAMTSQASQAEAMKFFVERFRWGKWDRTGIIWWNLIDGWPQFSDAVVDYYYAKKLAFYVIKRSQAPVCLMFREPENGTLTLVGANEFLKDITLSYCVTDLATGEKTCGNAFLPANSAAAVMQIPHLEDKMHFYVMEWEYEGTKGKNYYVCAKAPYDFDEYYRYMKESGMWETDGL